jgi:hypothetical protein
MPEFEPYLSLVVTARNDNHGGDLLHRMQIFTNGWIAQARRFNLPSELIVVEWNPVAGNPKLWEVLQWPEDRGPCDIRFIEVPTELHARYPHGKALPLYQMIAKNVGIRRARGKFVLATNIDILFNDELVEFLARQQLDPQRMYRIDRSDAMSDVPVSAGVEEQLAYCANHLLRINAREGTFPVSPQGRRTLGKQDIAAADSGFYFGHGWFPPERWTELFRWLDGEAELGFIVPEVAEPTLILEVEPGPSAGEEPVTFEIFDEENRLASVEISTRCELSIPMAAMAEVGRLHLRVSGAAIPCPSDPRLLHLRVLSCHWKKTAPIANSRKHDDVSEDDARELEPPPPESLAQEPVDQEPEALESQAPVDSGPLESDSAELETAPEESQLPPSEAEITTLDAVLSEPQTVSPDNEAASFAPETAPHRVTTPLEPHPVFSDSETLCIPETPPPDTDTLLEPETASPDNAAASFAPETAPHRVTTPLEPHAVFSDSETLSLPETAPPDAEASPEPQPAPTDLEAASLESQPTPADLTTASLEPEPAPTERPTATKITVTPVALKAQPAAPQAPFGPGAPSKSKWAPQPTAPDQRPPMELKVTVVPQSKLRKAGSAWHQIQALTQRVASEGPNVTITVPDRLRRLAASYIEWGGVTGWTRQLPSNLARALRFRKRAAPHADIFDSGVRGGAGWYQREVYRGEIFRWVNGAAGIFLPPAAGNSATLMLQIEPGPGVSHRPFDLLVMNQAGKLLGKKRISRLVYVEIPIARIPNRPEIVTLSTDRGGRQFSGDARVLDFRVFWCGVRQQASVAPLPADAPTPATREPIPQAAIPEAAVGEQQPPMPIAAKATDSEPPTAGTDAPELPLRTLELTLVKPAPEDALEAPAPEPPAAEISLPDMPFEAPAPPELALKGPRPGDDLEAPAPEPPAAEPPETEALSAAPETFDPTFAEPGPEPDLGESAQEASAADPPETELLLRELEPLEPTLEGTVSEAAALETLPPEPPLADTPATELLLREFEPNSEEPAPEAAALETPASELPLAETLATELHLQELEPALEGSGREAEAPETPALEAPATEPSLATEAALEQPASDESVSGQPDSQAQTAEAQAPPSSSDQLAEIAPETVLPPAPEPVIPPLRDAHAPVFLHTNGCGDFTLLSREKWFDLRAYPEWDLFSMNLDSVFCYAAHHGGATELTLPPPMRIFHIEHASGSGWTPEGETKLFDRIRAKGLAIVSNTEVVAWAAQMRRLGCPFIFNLDSWGMAHDSLLETNPCQSQDQSASAGND